MTVSMTARTGEDVFKPENDGSEAYDVASLVSNVRSLFAILEVRRISVCLVFFITLLTSTII